MWGIRCGSLSNRVLPGSFVLSIFQSAVVRGVVLSDWIFFFAIPSLAGNPGYRRHPSIHPSIGECHGGDLSRKSPWDFRTRIRRRLSTDIRIYNACYLLGRPGYTAGVTLPAKMNFPERRILSPGTTNLNNRQLDSYGTCARPISKETAFLV